MWCELISRLEPESKFFPPASRTAIASVEQKLETVFPEELKSLLLETDGVTGSYGLWVIWPLQRILERTLEMRSRERFAPSGPDISLYFADGGNGDYFAFAPDTSASLVPVWVWNHEEDTIRLIAPSLRSYLEDWLIGRLTI